MNRVDACEQQVAALFGERPNTGEGNNPELIQMLQRLIFGQISQIGPLDDQARELITCVVLSAYQTLPQLRVHARAALHVGLTPLTLREAVYGCMPLIGCPRTLNAIAVVDEVLAEHGHSLPLERAASVREETRETMGREMSAAVGGEGFFAGADLLSGQLAAGVEDMLTSYYFGDFYTRRGLEPKMRTLLDLVVLIALSSGEQALCAAAKRCLNTGNTAKELCGAILHALPYTGIPQALSALQVIRPLITASAAVERPVE